MKFATALLGAVAAFAGLVSANTPMNGTEALKYALTNYPECAKKCLLTTTGKSKCALTDIECQCANQDLAKDTEACILRDCTIFQALQTKNVTMTMCGAPVRDKHIRPLAISITGGTLATLSFVMRIFSTMGRKTGRKFGADDWLAGAALLMAAPPTLTALAFRDNGLGKDIWTLQLNQIKHVLMLYYLGSVFYIASVTMIKMSLICFILRIFPERKFRNICYGLMGLVAAYGVSFTVATALQCWPADYAWQRVDSSHKGTCNNVHLQAWMAAIFNIILDLILLILPLHNLWSLNMGIKKKMMIMIMFSLGIFVTIISTVRLHTLIYFASSTNITWDYVEAGYWSLVEMHASIICACLPYCRHFLVSLGANFLQSTNKAVDSRGYASQTTGRRPSQGASAILSSVGKTEPSETPKHGDESDFVPLVEYPHRNWDKTTILSTTKVSGSSSTDSI